MPSHRRSRSFDRLLVALSDIEIGAGGAVDDFLASAHLGERLVRYADPPFDDLDLDLVFNGDTFDLLKTSYRGGFTHHVSADVALEKMERIAGAHPAFFAALREILARRGERATIWFVVGNHDMELLFPEVQRLVRACIGREADERSVRFPGLSLDLGRVHLEHGAQLDPLFRMESERLFLDGPGERLLNLPWASVALLDAIIPLQPILAHHDRLKPKELVLELVPEVRELLTERMWSYWTRDYWRDFFRGDDPLKTVSWTMLKELVRRMVFTDVDVDMGDEFPRAMLARDDVDLSIVGHQHEPGWWSRGRRKVLRTGAIRDEFMLDERGEVQTMINKTWAEVLLSGAEVARSHLVEEIFPPRPEGTMPASIFDVVPKIRELLADRETQNVQRSEQQEQLRRERERD